MKRITDLRKRVADFNEALTSGRIIQNIIWDNEAYIVDLNAEEQLFEQGINRDVYKRQTQYKCNVC